MLSATDQLERIEAVLLDSGGYPIETPLIIVDDDGEWDVSGHLDLGLGYPTGHRLYVTLTVDVRFGYPLWTMYAFQFQDREGHTIFRYDNWPNHAEVTTFPHHKHVGAGEIVEPHDQPSLSSIIREVQRHVSSA